MKPTAETDVCDPSAAADECYCPDFHRTIELIGRRWTGAIMLVLLSGPRQFGAIRCEVPGLSDRLLSERLSELAEAGVVERAVDGRDATYRLTDRGEALRPTFDALKMYTEDWARSIDEDC